VTVAPYTHRFVQTHNDKKDQTMANSPLEIYDKAYRLHYQENNIPAAVEIYKRLITEFPDSNECGYAAIQLQKIQANNIVRLIESKTEKQGPMTLIGLLVGITALVVACLTVFLTYDAAARERSYNGKVSRALGLIATVKYDEALTHLNDLKMTRPGDLTPYALSANIYVLRGETAKAKAEFDQYRSVYGGNDAIPSQPAPEAKSAVPDKKAAAARRPEEDDRGQSVGESGPASSPRAKKRTPAAKGPVKPASKTELIQMLDSMKYAD